MKLFFTRHGESQANIERIISNRDLPHPLTAKGRTQAIALAEELATAEIGAIYASPILRAQQTAHLIGARLSLPVNTSAALREFDCGVMEGKGTAEAWAAHEAVTAAWATYDYAHCIPGGESFVDMQQRFVPFVTQLVAQYAGQTSAILLVSHGSLLHHMLPLVLRNIDRAFVAQHPLRNCACVCATVAQGGIDCTTWDGWVLP
jgi:2,3-bisphosphoglycerate-dependent phosphoglycerate mutase